MKNKYNGKKDLKQLILRMKMRVGVSSSGSESNISQDTPMEPGPGEAQNHPSMDPYKVYFATWPHAFHTLIPYLLGIFIIENRAAANGAQWSVILSRPLPSTPKFQRTR